MSEPSSPPTIGHASTFGPLLVAALVAAGAGAYLVGARGNWTLLAAAVAGAFAVLSAWGVASAVESAGRRATLARDAALGARLDKLAALLQQLGDQQLISDRAKSVAFREKDRDAFRKAIQDDLVKGDYEAALALVDELGRTFGYQQEADRLRADVLARRGESDRRQFNLAHAQLDALVRGEQWHGAAKEAERLADQYPNLPEAAALPATVERQHLERKDRLLGEWKGHVAQRRWDDAVDVLRRLDAYLAPAEAQQLEQEARMVFKEKLQRLGDDFSAAVHGQRWQEALRVGEKIVADFPNAQMAREVRESMPALRERLTGVGV